MFNESKITCRRYGNIVTDRSIVEVVQGFLGENVKTSDYNQVIAFNKAQLVEKMEDFAASSATVMGLHINSQLCTALCLPPDSHTITG